MWLLDTPLAHRGLHGEGVPENSRSAFAAAAEAGYGVELDVRLTVDGMPVVVHDPDLRRATGTDLRVGEITASRLAEFSLRGTDEPVPTLPQALGAVRGRTPVMVEIKSLRMAPGRIEPVVAAVLDAYEGPVCVATFNPRTLLWFRHHRPSVPRVLTAGPLHGWPLPASLRRRLSDLRDAAAVTPAAVSYELAGLPSQVTDAWRSAGGALVTWTVRNERQLQRARALADNVIFEHVRP
jgi:glycerophosphoryl diester phosphodiesterase